MSALSRFITLNPVVHIFYLADSPEFIECLATWQHHEWGNFVGARTLEQRKARLQEHLQVEAMPTTFVARLHGEPVGCASLIANDMPALSAWIPWLSSLYVLPQYRRQGIGARLVERVAAEAVVLGYPRLYLYTLDQMSFYEKLGWHACHGRHYRAHDMTVMARDLIVHPPRVPQPSLAATTAPVTA
jgi:N-acetylglutamate synthase-like GNAT family acetyltransferase